MLFEVMNNGFVRFFSFVPLLYLYIFMIVLSINRSGKDGSSNMGGAKMGLTKMDKKSDPPWIKMD